MTYERDRERARRVGAQALEEPAPVPGRPAPAPAAAAVPGRTAIDAAGRPRPLFGEASGRGLADFSARTGVLDMTRPSSPASASLFTLGGRLGLDQTNARGEQVSGAEVSGAAARVGYEDLERHRFGVDAGVGTFSAGGTRTASTTGGGLQANLAEGSVTAGTPEHNARFGLSAGLGFAARVHHGDADNDGIPEYGIGGDFGPFSFDIRSEMFEEGRRAAIANRARIDDGLAHRNAQPTPDVDTVAPAVPRLGIRPRR